VVLIPARGGSKSIPLKNLASLAGRPLIYWVTRACAESPCVDEVVVASDSPEIRECAEGFGLPKVRAIGRSEATSTDTATSESVFLEFAEKHDFGHAALVQATSPLLTSHDVTGAVKKYLSTGADSLLTVVRTKRFIWEEKGALVQPVNYDPFHRPRRQDWDGQLVENGALYMTSRDRLLTTRCRISGRIAGYEMPEETYYELDEPIDWMIIEQLLLARERAGADLAAKARELRLLCVDIDGTMTDGGMYYTEAGEAMKRFDTRDAAGMARLRRLGMELAIVTSEDSPIVPARAKKLRIEHVYVGVEDKEKLIGELLVKLGLTWEQMAYVGDDMNDLRVLQKVGFSACPADAVPTLAKHVSYVCRRGGGHGAVREVCDLIEQSLGGAAGRAGLAP
ncbi:MAG TPA: HAD hydrolase family protein, partial [Phycisphaerae bacterium]|nr:HAD hydrolase family protein [Phycisphaerae bacterium]